MFTCLLVPTTEPAKIVISTKIHLLLYQQEQHILQLFVTTLLKRRVLTAFQITTHLMTLPLTNDL